MVNGQLSGIIQHFRRAARLLDGGGFTDGQLLEYFIVRRDEAAFETLLRRHGPMVLGVCHRLLRHPQDAEDAFQATFLVLTRKAGSIGKPELVGNWLYGVARRAALEVKAARRRVRERQVCTMPEPATVDETAGWLDLRPVIDQELNRLPDKLRSAVVLCDLEGRTRREVARQLGIPEGTLSGRLTIARRMLVKRLARHGLMLPGGALAAVLSQNAASACVPPPLLAATIKAALGIAAGGAMTAGLISAPVAALTTGVLRTMSITRIQIATVVLLAFGVVASGTGLLTRQALAEKPGEADKNKVVAAQAAAVQGAVQGAEKKELPGYRGVLKAIDAGKGTLTVTVLVKPETKTDQTEDLKFTIAKDAKVFLEDRLSEDQPIVEGKLADLTQGTDVFVQLDVDRKAAVAISAHGPSLYGVVKSVDAVKNLISVTVKGQPDLTVTLAPDAKVLLHDGLSKEIKDQEGKLADLTKGTSVTLKLTVNRASALSVRVHGAEAHGVLKSYDAGNSTITVAVKEGGAITDKTFTVLKDARLGNLTEGLLVQLQLSVFDKNKVVAAQGIKGK